MSPRAGRRTEAESTGGGHPLLWSRLAMSARVWLHCASLPHLRLEAEAEHTAPLHQCCQSARERVDHGRSGGARTNFFCFSLLFSDSRSSRSLAYSSANTSSQSAQPPNRWTDSGLHAELNGVRRRRVADCGRRIADSDSIRSGCCCVHSSPSARFHFHIQARDHNDEHHESARTHGRKHTRGWCSAIDSCTSGRVAATG